MMGTLKLARVDPIHPQGVLQSKSFSCHSCGFSLKAPLMSTIIKYNFLYLEHGCLRTS